MAPRIMNENCPLPRALAHPQATEFWAVVDLIGNQDPAVVAHVYGAPAS